MAASAILPATTASAAILSEVTALLPSSPEPTVPSRMVDPGTGLPGAMVSVNVPPSFTPIRISSMVMLGFVLDDCSTVLGDASKSHHRYFLAVLPLVMA
ncbi:MAG: hypothetical protein BWY92_01652 [Firmicutes bacterium ADurb.BinA052]|nr:MAG: hypothetical protein BWY92_01652 [Firmicutes bacterium ADurb.BinA052]